MQWSAWPDLMEKPKRVPTKPDGHSIDGLIPPDLPSKMPAAPSRRSIEEFTHFEKFRQEAQAPKGLLMKTPKPTEPHKMSAVELQHYMDAHKEKDYILIDVRQPSEYESGHIPGARFLPLMEFEAKLFDLPENRDLIFYCHSGARSMAAAMLAVDAEVTQKNVYNLAGGVMGWQGKTLNGYPKVEIFDHAAAYTDLLYKAMNLEKGAWRFYDHIKRRYADEPYARTFKILSAAETAHAKSIYAIWKNLQQAPAKFDPLFAELDGEILEGGEALADMLQRVERLDGSVCLNLIEMGLQVESSAFDLYRKLADRTQDFQTMETLLTIAQAEKGHMRILIKAIDQCQA
jgi:rhodanese-related sulfurtransferase/rubrerythrin